MDDICEFVLEFFKAMTALAIITGIIAAILWVGSSLFGCDFSVPYQEWEARCRSVSGEWSGTNCYKDGEIVFSK